LVRRKYRLLFSSRPCPKKPGPKGSDEGVIRAIVELKARNPRFGCPRIARIISQTFGIDLDKNVVHRVLAKHYRPAPGGTGPSWLTCCSGMPVIWNERWPSSRRTTTQHAPMLHWTVARC